MKELIRHKLQHDFKRIKTSAKWVLFSIVSGLLVGGVGTLFYFGMYVVTLTRTKNPWLIFLLPVSGILIVGCYRLLHDEKDISEPTLYYLRYIPMKICRFAWLR